MGHIQEQETHEIRMMRKLTIADASYGHAIYQCSICQGKRIYGFGVPESKVMVMLRCEGTCDKNTFHEFLRVY